MRVDQTETLSAEAKTSLLVLALLSGRSQKDILKSIHKVVEQSDQLFSKNDEIAKLRADITKKIEENQDAITNNQGDFNPQDNFRQQEQVAALLQNQDTLKLLTPHTADSLLSSLLLTYKDASKSFAQPPNLQSNEDIKKLQEQMQKSLTAATIKPKVVVNTTAENITRAHAENLKAIAAHSLFREIDRGFLSKKESNANRDSAREELKKLKESSKPTTSPLDDFKFHENKLQTHNLVNYNNINQRLSFIESYINHLKDYLKFFHDNQNSATPAEINTQNFAAIHEIFKQQKAALAEISPDDEKIRNKTQIMAHLKKLSAFEQDLENVSQQLAIHVAQVEPVANKNPPATFANNLESNSLRTWEKMAERLENLQKFIHHAQTDARYTDRNEIDQLLTKMDSIIQDIHHQLNDKKIAHVAGSETLLNQFAQLATPLMQLRKNYGQVNSLLRERAKLTNEAAPERAAEVQEVATTTRSFSK